MTVVGHSLLAAALVAGALPRGADRRRGVWLGLVVGLLANAPDLPLPGWGHQDYARSHSAVIAVTAGAVAAAGSYWWLRRGAGGAGWARGAGGVPEHGVTGRGAGGIAVAVGLAWPSHLLLDALYAHGQGLDVGWPFRRLVMALPLPWFETLRLAPMEPFHNARVIAVEAAFYGLLLLAALMRRAPVHDPRSREDGAP